MKSVAAKYVHAFGVCVTIASLCSGCASSPGSIPMAYEDLDHFQPDCRIAVQQRQMLQSMRRTIDEEALDRLVGRDINKQINYNLFLLRYCQ